MSRMTLRLFCFLLCWTLLPAIVTAQNAVDTARPPTVTAVALTPEERLDLDGVLDEPVWNRAAPAGTFVQREPVTGAPATEQTEVRVAYDARRLLLGVTLHDSDPGGMLLNEMQRDASLDADDSFAWVVDSFLDGRTGYFFEINPAGAMGDGLVRRSAGGMPGGNDEINRSWDGIWTARVRRTSYGFT